MPSGVEQPVLALPEPLPYGKLITFTDDEDAGCCIPATFPLVVELPTSTSFLLCRNRCCRSSTAESELISGLMRGPIPRDEPELLRPTCSRSELIIESEQSVYNIFGGLGGFSMIGDVRFIPVEYFSLLTWDVCTNCMVLLLLPGPACIGTE